MEIIRQEQVVVGNKTLTSPRMARWERGPDGFWRSGDAKLSGTAMAYALLQSGQAPMCAKSESWVLLPV